MESSSSEEDVAMALKKVKGTLERVLDKNLQDLVRGIRNHKETEVCSVCFVKRLTDWDCHWSFIQWSHAIGLFVRCYVKNKP